MNVCGTVETQGGLFMYFQCAHNCHKLNFYAQHDVVIMSQINQFAVNRESYSSLEVKIWTCWNKFSWTQKWSQNLEWLSLKSVYGNISYNI